MKRITPREEKLVDRCTDRNREWIMKKDPDDQSEVGDCEHEAGKP